jgi:opacity protein-like surface antigen
LGELGRKQLDLYSSGESNQNSRLIYQGVIGQTAEGFARRDHRDGMFLKGTFGLGNHSKGQFYDEDFPPTEDLTRYSNTLSNQGDGRTLYGSLDVGHPIVAGPGGEIGAYVGYRYLYERDNGFGFGQLATGEIFQGSPVSNSLLGLTETEAWCGAAVGLNTRVQLADRWRLEVDAALLPFLGIWGIDNHWFRANINPGPEQGQGWGSQFEAIISYALTDQWSVGAGARYWYFASSSAHTQFPNTATNSPTKFFSERYGGFLQATYKFGGPSQASSASIHKAPPAPVSWTGLYLGGSLGAGFGRATCSDPFPVAPLNDNVQMGGGLAGGQIGANYQVGALVYGLEAMGSWARIEGSSTCFGGNPNQAAAGQNCAVKAGPLATLTARVGYATDRTLYFVKAGPAWGHSVLQLNFGSASPGDSTTTGVNRSGWTIGGGVEHALTDRWSVVGQYSYIDLGSATVAFAGLPTTIVAVSWESINHRYQVLALGLNYKLN